MIPLPIDDVLPEILRTLATSDSLVLRAPTGAGKTTRVAPAIEHAGLCGGKRVVLLQPRRVAARAASRRMAHERNVALGEEIGYQVRFDRKATARTKILVVTEGILTRMLQDDPFLEDVGAVLLDEFHERHLDTDLALGMTRRVQKTVRPDLKLVVMSATLAVEPVAAWLDGCPILDSTGRLFPVTIEYSNGVEGRPNAVRIAAAVDDLMRRTPGDILVFLPGVGEIRQASKALQPLADRHAFDVRPLYGDLPAEAQDAALRAGPRRKVVLSTNVAETSVTIEGVTAVVDTGLARVMQFDPHVGLDRLRLQPISKASAEQRAGRAGRTQPGICLRLWSEASHRARPEHETPEIRRVDLAGPALQLRCWGESDVAAFPWFEPPREATLARADRLLRRLGALDDAGPTALGQEMARLPVHPRLARLLIEGRRRGCVERAALAAALLSERDPFRDDNDAADRPAGGSPRGVPLSATSRHPSQRDAARQAAAGRRPTTPSDLLDRVVALEEYERTRRDRTAFGAVSSGAAHQLFLARDQLLRLVDSSRPRSGSAATRNDASRGASGGTHGDATNPPPNTAAFLQAVWTAFSDRLARRREAGGARGLMVGGKGVVLGPESAVRDAEFFVCLDLDAGRGEAVVRKASAVDRRWIDELETRATVDLFFEEATSRVAARRRVWFEDLMLEESPAAVPSNEEAARTLATAAAERWERVYPPLDDGAEDLIRRVRCLRVWMPELGLPSFDEAELKAMLPELALGCRGLLDLKRAPWHAVLHSKLKPTQRAALDREAPERIAVPSGSKIAVQYEEGRPPIMAVRIQELFGLKSTPRVAGGRVSVVMHLLAPNMRPQQITDDLASFWANGYPRVRKELRARYPKHSWPEDPTDAPPQRRPGKR